MEAAGYPASYAKHAQDWDRYPLSVIEKAILSLLPNGVSVREECAKAENLRHRLRMIVSHATGGQDMPEDASVNDICVEITRVRNTVYQAGKDSASPLSTLEGEGH